MRILALTAFVICLILGAGLTVSGQTGEIAGEVTDPTGAALTQADVRAINQATLVERHSQTNDAGLYTFSFVTPGIYKVVVEVPGFSTMVSEPLTLTVGQALVFNVQLKLGEAQQETTISAESQTINATDAQVSNIVDEREIEDLPNILRNPYQLVLLSGGVNATNNGDGGFSVNGGRETSNRFLLDGGENNDVEFPSNGITAINPDSAQEFRVLTNNFMPEYGRSNGAIIYVATKSGSNKIHGDIYEFGRWAVLGARDYFNHGIDPITGTVEPKNPYTRNIFGAALGGPIQKDKTFFFFNYEGARFATTLTEPIIVPTQQFLTGKFTFIGQNQNTNLPEAVPIDVSLPNSAGNIFGLRLDPVVRKIFGFYPAPNLSLGNGIQGLAFTPQGSLTTGDNYTVKVDRAFSSAENLSARYILNNGSQTNQSLMELQPGLSGFNGTSRTQTLAVELFSAFNYKWQNDLIASVTRYNSPSSCTGLTTLNSLGQPDAFGDTADAYWATGIQPWGCTFLADTDRQTRGSGSYDLSDKVTHTAGRHTLKFGGQVDDLYSNNSLGFFSRGILAFGNFEVFGTKAVQTNGSLTPVSEEILQDMVWNLFGQAVTQVQDQFFTLRGTRLHTDELNMRAHDFSGFGQDSFRVSSNLTLNYGLLWEFNGVPYEANNRLSTVPAAELSGPPPVTFQNIGQNGAYLYRRQWLVPQPRAGFAWDPFGTGKTSIRGAVGIFRDRTFFEVADFIRDNPPLAELYLANIFIPPPSPGAPPVFIAPPLSTLPPPRTIPSSPVVPNGAFLDSIVVDQNLSQPYSENWNFGVQRQLRGNIQVEVNYVGVLGKKLLRYVDGNQPIPALVAQLRAFCEQPNPYNCVNTPTVSTVASTNLYIGKEEGLLPFDAVHNSAEVHPTLLQDEGNSSYNGVQASVTKRFSHGLYVQSAYTWSHVIDNTAFPIVAQAGQTPFPTNSFDPDADRGNGSFDIRQTLSINYVWELPFGRRKPYWNQGLVGKVLEGWSLSGVTRFQGGFPYDIFSNIDSNGTGGNLTGSDPDRADYNPQAPPLPVMNPRTQISPNPGFFLDPPYGRGGDLGRDTFRAPGINNWDMVLAKETKVNERLSLVFRGECYNVFNRVQFAPPLLANDVVGNPLLGQSIQQEGRPDGTTGARQIQFALKLKF